MFKINQNFKVKFLLLFIIIEFDYIFIHDFSDFFYKIMIYQTGLLIKKIIKNHCTKKYSSTSILS
jgi:hypothetical protein